MKKAIKILVCSILVASTMAFSGCEEKDEKSVTNKEKLENLKLPLEKDGFIQLGIYFDGTKDGSTVKVVKDERIVNKEELIGETIIQELIKGPTVKSELKPVLPKETRLLSFSIKDNIAYVNLSKEAKINMSEAKEKSCLQSIAASLTQLSSIKKIKLTLENNDIDTIGGNFDVSKPFSKEGLTLLKK
ncbi:MULTISPECIES: GerMN domain-containing protein [Clostridium]|uniref:Sporulation/spore germination protein n=3 Tax=Clostridium TaxID=1485 RepID=A0A1J0GME0_9CLOT|nr:MULTISPECIES: GerMN domain-containing protein [Clostridium]APC42431.1 sporulation/spore germination protein [Clostridium estertheticum subsp. estertheticum]MBU3075346.1 GerMN domain-containing protein [Clostridium estertheticum]MBU3100963.1 GerMN domain-containing protein [Clostridium sp. DSM 17811]MBU3164883.1 GerMN domain-containing protein [Clostridium estertheticum]MBU3174153.1 GerMN domain-containing protein [Clostridium estertheticum]